MKKIISLASGFSLVLAAVAGGAYLGGNSSSKPTASDSRLESVVLGSSLSLLPSESAEDWAAYADLVAVVSVTSERAEAIPEDELERGEGNIKRYVGLRIDELIWSRNESAGIESLTMQTPGWVWKDHDPTRRQKFALGERSRFEVGNQYLVALAKFPGITEAQAAICGDSARPALWGPVGDEAMLPIENGILGQGEMEGVEVSQKELQAFLAAHGDGGGTSFRSLIVGRDVGDLAPLLEVAAKNAGQKEIPTFDCAAK
ncbi:hypothetical protein ACLM5J_06765 [Nocardioides sp. Bht2]|uniref:hypothetical protein n=1 Tax=Nocardioides sp. Bht2 TaxID=3392297 RepID=UPI0039B52231